MNSSKSRPINGSPDLFQASLPLALPMPESTMLANLLSSLEGIREGKG